jgi:hypothetical protein
VGNIAEKNNCLQREDALAMVGNWRCIDVDELSKQWREEIKQWREKIIAGLPQNEQEILSLQSSHKDKSLEWIKNTFWKEIQGIIDLFVKYNYFCKPETIARLNKLWMPTENLKVKQEEKNTTPQK